MLIRSPSRCISGGLCHAPTLSITAVAFFQSFLKQLTGALFVGALSTATAAATPPTVDHKQGGSISITAPSLPLGAQLALIPGEPYLKIQAALKTPALSMVSDGQHAYIAAGDNGLLVFDLAPDLPPRLLAQVKGQGKITQVVLYDGYAYLTDSAGALLTVDVSNPQQPRQIASYPLTQPLDALCAKQGRAYLVSDKHLSILDVSHPQMPQQLASFTLAGAATAVQVADGYAYLALPKVGLSILDVRDLSGIHEVGHFRGEVRDLAVAQGRAYLANGTIGLTVLDVSQPQAPHWMGSVNRIGTSLALSYDDGYIALRNDRSEIILIDARNPKLPKVVTVHHAEQPPNVITLAQKQVLAGTDTSLGVIDFSAPVPNVVNIGANFGGSRRAVIRDHILYVADWFSGLHLYDISEPASPRHLAAYHTQGSAKGVLVRGNYAYIGDDDHGVQIIDVSNPKQLHKISEVATPGLAYTMKLGGDYLYLADHRGGFHIISVADIAHPVIISSAPTAGKAWAVELVDGLAYVAADNAGLLVFDVNNPQQPKQIAAYDLGGAAEDVVIRDHLAYVASFDNGLHILDVSQPLQAREIGHLATPGNARGIELDGNTAYVADWTSGIQIVDIANPEQPALVGAYDTIGWSWGVRVQGHYAYVLDWWGGLAVLDVSDPAVPALAGAYHARGLTQDVAVKDSYAYVADGKNGLQIFDVKNPQNPIWLTGVDVAGDTKSVWLEGNTAYLAAGEGGLVVLDIGNPFEPQQLKQYALHADLVRAQDNHIYVADQRRGIAIIDAVTGKQTSWYTAKINDMWPANNGRLLLATPTGVEILDADDPSHPRLIRHLPQHTELLRLQNNLLALYDKATGITLYDYAKLKRLGRFNPGERISDLQITGDRLYASGSLSGLLVLDISNARKPVLKAIYSAANHVTKFRVFSGTAFMAGNETLASVRLLPDVTFKQNKRGVITVHAAPQLPLGSYHLLALDARNGKRVVYHDALRSVMPALKKPRFSLQDFERAMRERGLNPAPH